MHLVRARVVIRARVAKAVGKGTKSGKGKGSKEKVSYEKQSN